VVVLANVYRLGAPDIERLEAFVRAGAGLWIFLGDQVDADAYNDELYADGSGLLPVALGEVVEQGAGGVPLGQGDYLHPVVRVFSGGDNPFLKRIAFTRYFRIANSELPIANEENDAPRPVVAATFDDADRTPAIVEQRFGAGRVMLVNATCDLEWSDWAKDPSYVVAVLEMARYLARPGAASGELVVGTPIEVRLDPRVYQAEAVLRTPGYPAERETALTAVPDPDGAGLLLRWAQTGKAGLYQFLLRRRDGRDETRLVAVNVDPGEGDLTVAGEQDLRRAMPEVSFAYLRSDEGLDELDQAGRKELWLAFLVAALAVLLGEQGLAFWFGRRV